MPTIVGVSFKPVTKIYYFDPGVFLDLQAGDYVVVETSQGREVGLVIWQPKQVPNEEVSGSLKPVVRRATPLDLVERDYYKQQENAVLAVCRAKAAEHRLPMKVVSAEYSFDGSRLVVSFTSESRIDFREVVRDLAKTFSTRIEMKQIGVRDEAKELDGLGKCGRRLCCSAWLRDFDPVTIKMAKQQNLPLNPPEISGVCGRLLCCLAYEMDVYDEARARLPKVGVQVETADGKGRVRKVHPLRDLVTVRLDEDESMRDYPVEELIGFSTEGKAKSCGCTGCSARRGSDPKETKDDDTGLFAAQKTQSPPSDELAMGAGAAAPRSRSSKRRRKRGSQ